MIDNKYFEEFGKPFAAKDVSWKIQLTNKEETSGLAVPYLDARAIADRLDAVVGQNRWKDEYKPWHNYMTKNAQKFAQLCTIYIYDEDLQEWIGKTDGAEDSDIEPIKGGLSDAFKRAAVRWNIGRYMYQLEPVWADIEPRGNSFIIKKSEYAKLDAAYVKAVAKIFGAASAPQNNQSTPLPEPKQNNTVQTNTPIYEIKNLKVNNGASVENSSVLVANGKKQYKAYILGRDERLKIGSKITNVKFEKMSNSYGTYNLIQAYDIAA